MGYLFPNRTDDLYDSDELVEAERRAREEPDEEEQLAHLESLLANPRWCATSGQRRHPLTRVLEVDRVRAEAEALREAMGLDDSEEREARQAEQDAYDAHVDAATLRARLGYEPLSDEQRQRIFDDNLAELAAEIAQRDKNSK